jgi:hypothetical protein
MFRNYILFPSSGLKIKAVSSTETLVLPTGPHDVATHKTNIDRAFHFLQRKRRAETRLHPMILLLTCILHWHESSFCTLAIRCKTFTNAACAHYKAQSQNASSYCIFSLLSHVLKIWERQLVKTAPYASARTKQLRFNFCAKEIRPDRRPSAMFEDTTKNSCLLDSRLHKFRLL